MDSRVFLAISLCFLSLFPDLAHSAVRFPGWLRDKKTQGSVLRLPTGASYAHFDPTRVTQISWHPRAFIYKGFLTDEECDHLIRLAKDKLEKSMVADNESGKSIASEVRTSSGMFLKKAQVSKHGLAESIDSLEEEGEPRARGSLLQSPSGGFWGLAPGPGLETCCISVMVWSEAAIMLIFLPLRLLKVKVTGQRWDKPLQTFCHKIPVILCEDHGVTGRLMSGARILEDEVVAGIESRLASWTFLPEENGEAMQILHYEHGEKYEPHFDYFHDKANQELGGHRVATVLMYLSDVKRGGETIFPNSEAKDTQPKEDNWSDCAKNGYAAKPGNKDCTDDDAHCAQWAANGECKRNPVYMVGSEESLGYCRKSCKGSSGRIWDNHLQLEELKPGGLHATMAFEKAQQVDLQDKGVPYQQPPPSGSENRVRSLDSPPPSRSESKAPKCAFSAIFRLCVRSPA
ncbi:oxoglutarate/iron-dependent oxygenase [Actinidia rufa]|uniref:procollagen-proline 4-dioxygenase n=1 Tax=Actinidia rufa TaxID=165716 RepID=A0A7J0E998_9ERIC|nr:oxoglutarate/iron-dependent oxygenase [Actinidia rufa]